MKRQSAEDTGKSMSQVRQDLSEKLAVLKTNLYNNAHSKALLMQNQRSRGASVASADRVSRTSVHKAETPSTLRAAVNNGTPSEKRSEKLNRKLTT